MTSETFKPGDRVRCVDDHFGYGRLARGNEYEVSWASGKGINLVGVPNFCYGYDTARFELVSRAKTYSDGLAEGKAARDERQGRVAQWCADAFGADHASNIEQRGIRLAEEAIEAAQATGCNPAMIHKLVDYIYAKPPGDLKQELGGVGLCLLALANAAGLRADATEQAEMDRVLSKPLSFFADRNRVKNEAGFIAGYQQPIEDGKAALERVREKVGDQYVSADNDKEEIYADGYQAAIRDALAIIDEEIKKP